MMFSWRLRLHVSRTFWCLLPLLLSPTGAIADTYAHCEQQFAPRSGEPGKDVMWVATIDSVVDAMLRVARVTDKDRVVDLGSGDGKIPIAAAKRFGASALGIEYNPQLVQLARCYAHVDGLADKVRFEQGDIFDADFSNATVLTLYLGPTVNLKLRPKLLGMRAGTRIVSNTFDLADWEPDELIEADVGNTRALMWIVPARVEGEWKLSEVGGSGTFTVRLQQRFQHLRSSPGGESRLGVQGGRLEGNRIEMVVQGLGAEPTILTGEVSGDRLLLATTKAGTLRRFVGAPM